MNQGVDFNSIVRAAYTNVVQHGISQGGSTITQQLIKQNVLNSNESFERKIKEAILAYGMTTQGVFSKRQIIEMYLNSIPYGQEAYGIDAAARSYFGYTDDSDSGVSAAQHLDLAQASMLAGIPQNPNLNNPLLHPQHAHDRQVEVLRNMVEQGYITQKQADQAAAESLKPGFFKPQPAPKNLAPHFVNFIRDQLEQMVETGQLRNLSRSGLNVYTTLDLDLQNHVQDAIKQHLYGDDRDDYVGHHFIRDDHLTNSAAIIADHHTGAIKVMLGSVDYYSDKIDGQFNVATQGYRGPGSSFKPIVYATAFSKGWFPAMTVSDMPTVFWDEGQNRVYKPLNFNIDQFEGNITLRKALQWSLNIPAVKVMQYAGIDDVERNAMRMGIRKWQGQWGLSSVLGSLDVTLYDMTQAYTVFANEGKYIPMYSIDHITDGASNVLFQYHAPLPVQVLSPQVAYMVTSVLSDNPARAGDFGTCSPLYLDPSKDDCLAHNGDSPNAWPAAAKTGTGQDFRDDWTLGYTMDYTMGVWAGNNDHTPMVRIDGITGAAPTWYRSLIYAEQNLPKRAFPVPDGMQRATYTSNGVTSTDWFLAGPLPPPEYRQQRANRRPLHRLSRRSQQPLGLLLSGQTRLFAGKNETGASHAPVVRVSLARRSNLIRIAEIVERLQAVDELAVHVQIVLGVSALAAQRLVVVEILQGDTSLVEDALGDVDRRLHAHGKRDGVAGTRIHLDMPTVGVQYETGIVDIVAELMDDDAGEGRAQLENDRLEQVMRDRAR